jgi:hypothetical protein
MGYRSEVHSIIYGDPETMDALIAKEKLLGDQGIFKLFGEIQTYSMEGLSVTEFTRNRWVTMPDTNERQQVEVKFKLLSLYGSDWKWYDDFEDVKHWHKLLHQAEDMGLQYEHARIGEETDDMELETSGDAEYFLNISRTIDYDYG